MGRRALEPGENGKITMRGRHPRTGRWTSDARLKAEKVRPKRWRAEVRYHDPSLHRVRVLTAEGDTKGEAEASLQSALRALRDGGAPSGQAGHMTVEKAMRAHLRRLEGGDIDLAPATVRAYAAVIRAHMLSSKSIIRNVALVDLTALQLEHEMVRISALGAHSQLRNWRAIMNTVLQRAVRSKAIEENPMRLVGPIQAPRTAERKVYGNGFARRANRALSAEDDRRLAEQLKHERAHTGDLVRVIRWQGLRISEAISLRLEDVDLEAGTVSVRGKLVRVRGEGMQWDPVGKSVLSLRTLPIREGARGALERRVRAAEERGESEYIFTPPRGAWPDKDYYVRLLRGVFDRAGLPDVTAHTLRRTVERELEMAGATVSERETFMGHTEKVARAHYADHGAVRTSVIAEMDQDKRGV